jgi:L-2-hydroxyglutarate oxidase
MSRRTLIIGGGIVGLAVARELSRRDPGRSIVLLEKEEEVGRHQSTHNSGVLHAGLYYQPGSL